MHRTMPKTAPSSPPWPLLPWRRDVVRLALAALALTVLALTAPACVSSRQVEEIVDRSNAELLQPLPLVTESVDGGGWQEEVGRIDAFIAAHGDQPTLIAPLRLRQALLLTVHGQDNLALATFDLVSPTALVTERDRALFALREDLVRWFKVSRTFAQTDPEDTTWARAALTRFDSENDPLPPGSEIRHYLEEMRAWICLALAKNQAREEEILALLESCLGRYAAQLTAEDLTRVRRYSNRLGADDPAVEVALEGAPRTLRLPLRSLTVVEEYRKEAEKQDLTPGWQADPGTAALLAAVAGGGEPE